MTLPPDLMTVLNSLSDYLDDPTIDFEDLVNQLAASMSIAVESLMSVTVEVVVEHFPFSLTVVSPHDDALPAASSVRIPLTQSPLPEARSILLMFASRPGAFVDLAADMTYAMKLDSTTVELDLHLARTTDDDADDLRQRLDDFTAVHQAVGVLVERGSSPEGAREEMTRLAERDGSDVADIARSILDGITRRHRP